MGCRRNYLKKRVSSVLAPVVDAKGYVDKGEEGALGIARAAVLLVAAAVRCLEEDAAR